MDEEAPDIGPQGSQKRGLPVAGFLQLGFERAALAHLAFDQCMALRILPARGCIGLRLVLSPHVLIFAGDAMPQAAKARREACRPLTRLVLKLMPVACSQGRALLPLALDQFGTPFIERRLLPLEGEMRILDMALDGGDHAL